MAFDDSGIAGLTLAASGANLFLRWSGPGPAYQVYVDGRLAWSGPAAACVLPRPREMAEIRVGAVAAGEVNADLGATLPGRGGTGNRAELAWTGGSYLAEALAGFRVYGSAAPGAAVDYGAPLADVPAYVAGQVNDGYGLGGYGEGGYGRAASSYSWTSGRLGPGTWTFAVVPYDAAGNACAAPTTAAVTIEAPPRPPAPDGAGRRLAASYDPATGAANLAWLPSPA